MSGSNIPFPTPCKFQQHMSGRLQVKKHVRKQGHFPTPCVISMDCALMHSRTIRRIDTSTNPGGLLLFFTQLRPFHFLKIQNSYSTELRMRFFSNKYRSLRKLSSESGDESETFLQEKSNRKFRDESKQLHRNWVQYLTWPLAVHTIILFIWVAIALFVIRATTFSSQRNLLLSYCNYNFIS